MKVKNLMQQLSTLNPEQPIVFQFLTAEHAGYSEEEFLDIANWLMGSSEFGEQSSDFFKGWIEEANELFKEWEEQE